jgi:aldose sugar dehydrogenase
MKKRLAILTAAVLAGIGAAGAWVVAQQHPRADEPNGVTSGKDTSILRAKIEGDTVSAEEYTLKIVPFLEGTSNPWGIAFLNEHTGLLTEKGGKLRMFTNGKFVGDVKGLPEMREHGQGGLMAVAFDPNFDKEPWVYLGYTHFAGKGQMTRIIRGKIDGNRWTGEQVLFEAKESDYRNAGVHFGTRIVFDKQGYLYFAIGDRGAQNQAQDINRPNGKTFRINRDGSIPKDNPFVGKDGAYEAIFTYGNRNPQGLAIHPETDQLWTTEHGPRGGDELNLMKAGQNYGWPVITYGINYNGTPVTAETHKDGMLQPILQWTPSLAVCGLDFYTGKPLAKWNNRLLVGSLAAQELRLLTIDGEKVVREEIVLDNIGRIRDVKVGPDGRIYVVFNGPDKVVALEPK